MLETLRAVEQHLAKAVAAAQCHLEAITKPEAIDTLSKSTSDEINILMNTIQQLQDELQTMTATIVAKSRQNKSQENVGTVADSNNILDIDGSSTETEDEMMWEERNVAGEGEPHDTNTSTRTTNLKETPLLPMIEGYTTMIYQTVEAQEISSQSGGRANSIVTALKRCRMATDRIVQEITINGFIADNIADMYRDATLQLRNIISHKHSKRIVPPKFVVEAIDSICKLLELALDLVDKDQHVPEALFDPRLELTVSDLKQCFANNCHVALMEIQRYMSKKQNGQHLNKVIPMFQRQLGFYKPMKANGMNEVSDEISSVISEIMIALETAIGHSQKKAPPKGMKALVRSLGRFHKLYPGRFSPTLYQTAKQQMQCCKKQQRGKRKSKRSRGK